MSENVTTVGKEFIAALVGGSAVGSPVYLGIGSGSGTFSSTRTGLIYEVDRNVQSSVDMSAAQEVLYTFDYTSVEMSGIQLREFGQFAVSSGNKCWAGAGFTPITFDGNQELQVQITWRMV